MPDISKINALAIGSVSKVDGLAKASISTIDGVSVPGAFILDVYTDAYAAYSVRQLKTGVTIAMRVRRDTAGGTGDDDEADVAFDTTLSSPTISLDSAVSNFSATSNATNLGQFLNATGYTDADSLTVVADGFTVEWKDQSGSGYHVEQTTYGSQPQIFDSASPTDLMLDNGKPALAFDGTATGLTVVDAGINFLQPNTAVAVAQTNVNTGGSGSRQYVYDNGATQRNLLALRGSFTNKPSIWAGAFLASTSSTTTTQALYFSLYNGTSSQIGIDGATATTGNANTFAAQSAINIGMNNTNALDFLDGNIQEVIMWNADQTSPTNNRTGIETDINGFFGIY